MHELKMCDHNFTSLERVGQFTEVWRMGVIHHCLPSCMCCYQTK